jgi:16S rRNA U516 pseudouridylate synthase RsuA-like enzyme
MKFLILDLAPKKYAMNAMVQPSASITVNEGKFRQIRKMTAAVGFPTLRLVRIRIEMYICKT